jgi:serine/threonine protein kinase
MAMKSSNHQKPQNCPSCGTLLDHKADSPAVGLCPRCLLADSLHSTIAGHRAASPPPSLEDVAAAFPDLEVVELIGKGGMGAVYKARQKSLDRFVALKLLPQSLAAVPSLCEALEFSHKRNIVHCDIKHENLLLDTHGRVKVADFGIARILGQAEPEMESDQLAGTPAYMAPDLRWQSANALNTELQSVLTIALGEPKVTPPEKTAEQ